MNYGRTRYLVRYDALVGRPPAPGLLPCVQEVGCDVAEAGHLDKGPEDRDMNQIGCRVLTRHPNSGWKNLEPVLTTSLQGNTKLDLFLEA